MELEPALQRLHISGYDLRAMRRMAVKDKEYGPSAVAHEGLELLDEARSIECAGINIVPECPECIHCRDGVDALALAARRDRRRPTLGPPRPLHAPEGPPASSMKKMSAPRCLARLRRRG